ncbi:MAG TPA: hypothetical protein VEC16_05415 [Alphaproteobacteria bacterium]|nr:hypothetical protein [Alphaproteobacteria bacterium]
MQTHKICNLCGTGSEDTAVFTCSYAKGELHICLGCLAEGILETLGNNNKPKVQQLKQSDIDPMVFDLSRPDEVYGFTCESCSSIMFSEMFPVQCEHCQHINHQTVLSKHK